MRSISRAPECDHTGDALIGLTYILVVKIESIYKIVSLGLPSKASGQPFWATGKFKVLRPIHGAPTRTAPKLAVGDWIGRVTDFAHGGVASVEAGLGVS